MAIMDVGTMRSTRGPLLAIQRTETRRPGTRQWSFALSRGPLLAIQRTET